MLLKADILLSGVWLSHIRKNDISQLIFWWICHVWHCISFLFVFHILYAYLRLCPRRLPIFATLSLVTSSNGIMLQFSQYLYLFIFSKIEQSRKLHSFDFNLVKPTLKIIVILRIKRHPYSIIFVEFVQYKFALCTMDKIYRQALRYILFVYYHTSTQH